MEAAVASVIAVVGTLLGAGVSYTFQLRTARQARQFTREDRLWQEQLAAYSAYASALTAYRQAQYDRWLRRQDDPSSVAFRDAVERARRERTEATAALYRIRLVTSDDSLTDLGDIAWTLTDEIHSAADEADRVARGAKARRGLADFIEAASGRVRAL